MTRRDLGLGLMGFGAILVLIGVGGWLASGGEDSEVSAETGTTLVTGVDVAPTTQSTSGSTAPAVSESTTSSQAATTTSTVDVASEIETFVPVFANAIAEQDVDFLFSTLHPAVVAIYDEPTCQAHIGTEILDLADYRLVGEIEGPDRQSVSTFSVDIYEGRVSFNFDGQPFTATATWAILDDEVTWFTQCDGS